MTPSNLHASKQIPLEYDETQQPGGTAHRMLAAFMHVIWTLTFPITFPCSVRVLQPFESVVVHRLGKVTVYGGKDKRCICWINPLTDRIQTFDTRPTEIELSEQKYFTAEMVPVSLSLTVRQQIFNPKKLVMTTKHFVPSDTLTFIQATTLDVIASTTLSELCGQRRVVTQRITETANALSTSWGIAYDVFITDAQVPSDVAEALKLEAEVVSRIYAMEVEKKVEKESHRIKRKLARATGRLQAVPNACTKSLLKPAGNPEASLQAS
uniref:PHB domain-containing protein n=1 Tax=Trichuris muris TaxID=70415 RepID=A0A5S6Q206_TRIMR